MKKYLLMSVVLLMGISSFARGVSVNGYYRKNGTYVKSYTRSSPDSSKWNNYGSSYGDSSKSKDDRDDDSDGISNYRDHDDDNDGIDDDNE